MQNIKSERKTREGGFISTNYVLRSDARWSSVQAVDLGNWEFRSSTRVGWHLSSWILFTLTFDLGRHMVLCHRYFLFQITLVLGAPANRVHNLEINENQTGSLTLNTGSNRATNILKGNGNDCPMDIPVAGKAIYGTSQMINWADIVPKGSTTLQGVWVGKRPK